MGAGRHLRRHLSRAFIGLDEIWYADTKCYDDDDNWVKLETEIRILLWQTSVSRNRK